jgi:hypothetical protein
MVRSSGLPLAWAWDVVEPGEAGSWLGARRTALCIH